MCGKFYADVVANSTAANSTTGVSPHALEGGGGAAKGAGATAEGASGSVSEGKKNGQGRESGSSSEVKDAQKIQKAKKAEKKSKAIEKKANKEDASKESKAPKKRSSSVVGRKANSGSGASSRDSDDIDQSASGCPDIKVVGWWRGGWGGLWAWLCRWTVCAGDPACL